MSQNRSFKDKIFPSIISQSLKVKLEEFRNYTSEIESKFEEDKYKLGKSYIDITNKLSIEEQRDIQDYYSEEYYLIDEIFIEIYRKSTLISIYSILENSMNNLCRYLYKREYYSIEYTELIGKGIERAKKYLEKFSNIDFQILNNDWSKLQSLNKIRNCIIHCEGNIKLSKNYSKLKNIIENNPNLILKNCRIIKVKREYIESIIDIVEKFIDELHRQAF